MIKIRAADAISIIANIGVLAGIGFLAYEIRQNTQAIQGVTVQALVEQGMGAAFIGVENPELRHAYLRAGRGLEYLTPEDSAILAWWYGGVLRIAENRYRQAALGTVSEDLDQLLGGGFLAYRHPFFGAYWRSVRPYHSKDFADWVDANLIPLVQDSIDSVVSPDVVPTEIGDALPRDSSSK